MNWMRNCMCSSCIVSLLPATHDMKRFLFEVYLFCEFIISVFIWNHSCEKPEGLVKFDLGGAACPRMSWLWAWTSVHKMVIITLKKNSNLCTNWYNQLVQARSLSNFDNSLRKLAPPENLEFFCVRIAQGYVVRVRIVWGSCPGTDGYFVYKSVIVSRGMLCKYTFHAPTVHELPTWQSIMCWLWVFFIV